MVKIILMTSHFVLSENSHLMIILYKHLYGQKHSHDVRIRSLGKLSFHTTIPLIIPYKHLDGQNILMSSDYVLPVNSHFMTQKTSLHHHVRFVLKVLTPSNKASTTVDYQSLHGSELHAVIATLHSRTLLFKFAIVRQLEPFLTFFHFVPDVQPYGNYSNVYIYNALKNNDPSFCRDLNVCTTSHRIYDNNEAALNSSGYFFRAYKITTSTEPTYHILLVLGNNLFNAYAPLYQ